MPTECPVEFKRKVIHATGYLDDVLLQRKLKTLEDIYRTEDAPYSVLELCEALGVA